MWVAVFRSLLLPQGERFGIVLGYSYQGILLLYPQTAPPTAGEQWDPKTSVGEEAAGPGKGGIREPTTRQGRPGPSICGEDHPAATGVDLGPPFPFQCFSTPLSACGDSLSLSSGPHQPSAGSGLPSVLLLMDSPCRPSSTTGHWFRKGGCDCQTLAGVSVCTPG